MIGGVKIAAIGNTPQNPRRELRPSNAVIKHAKM
jgi:hypothetical protein